MKNPILKLPLFLVAALIFVSSCKKENTATGTTYSSLTDLFDKNKIATQTFSVNAATGGSITGAKGTKVTFPANGFIDGNGHIVTGSVNIELKEVFSKGDMIFSGVFPLVDNYFLLNSGGEYSLNATQNGNKVNLQKGHFFEMRLPAQAADPNMQFFIGMDTMGGVNWQLPDTAFVQVDSQFVQSPVSGFNFTTIPDSAYVINCDSLGWGNADVFMNPAYVPCSFVVTGGQISSANTKAYCIYDGKNTVWPSGLDGFGGISANTISDTHIAAIPVHFLVISVINGELYAGSTAVTPALNGSYPVTIAPVTKEALDALILSFN